VDQVDVQHLVGHGVHLDLPEEAGLPGSVLEREAHEPHAGPEEAVHGVLWQGEMDRRAALATIEHARDPLARPQSAGGPPAQIDPPLALNLDRFHA